jgi:hypothetical protein
MDKKRLREKVEFLRINSAEGLYTIHDKATEADVSFFESKFGVNIPDDLKWFVLNIANGITNSKNPTSNIIKKIDFNNYYYEEDAYNPAVPFKPTQRVVTGSVEYDNNSTYPYTTFYDPDHDNFDIDQNGYIALVGHGCGAFDFIVINGAEYGNIWIDNYCSNSEILPLYNKERQLDRLDFETWVNEQLDTYISYYCRKEAKQ